MRHVCITIDTEFPDHPCADQFESLARQLDVLAARKTLATFFVVGAWAKANPDRVAAIRDAGHQVANHSYSHCNLARMSEDGIVADLTECHGALAKHGIETRPWFRAPYGEMTADARVRDAVRRAGYENVPWNVDSDDWSPDATEDQIAARVLAGVKRRWPRLATVLFHSWPDATPGALALLLDQLLTRRATFITVGEAAAPIWSRGRARSLLTNPPDII